MNERPSEAEIERARQAIMDAPKAESGLVLPPHVIAEQEALAAAAWETAAGQADGPALNRAQRREHERRLRRSEKRDARLAARRTAEQIESIERFVAMTDKVMNELTPAQRKRAVALLKSIEGLPAEEQRAAVERFRQTGSIHAA